ncbi:MAG: phenylalanine--tRNA ligase subunit beta [bacterium]
MKYSYNWLKELSETKKTATQVADLITKHSFEVESVEKIGSDFAGIVVGKILEISKHPNADKLQLTKVEIGQESPLDIVCGAHNISVGDHVPVATVGTKLPNGIEIREAEIRGMKSFGMLCAEDEIGLGKSHAGILILDKEIGIGTPLSEVFANNDEILDIKVLPDRAHDAVSHVAMAREIVALEGGQLDYDYDGLILEGNGEANLEIKIENSDLCPRYIGARLSGVTVKKSPDWMIARLEACGLNAINNIVDATNYVMLELGQPLHAFDADVVGSTIVTRLAKDEEEIVLLDGNVKKLASSDIVIANNEKVLALAGIMGGKDSGISDQTENIILEAANFKAISIRRTRSRLNMLSDASMRFEKELDPNLAEKAMVRVIEILEHTANASFEGFVDVYPEKVSPWKIELEKEYIDKLLGTTVPAGVSEKILSSLGIEIESKDEKVLIVTIPTYRIDLKSQEDLIEEIGRIYGYEKIQNVAPLVPVTAAKQNEARIFERNVKKLLIASGFSEVLNYSFYSLQDQKNSHFEHIKHYELETPMNPDQNLLRVSLLPNIFKKIRENLKNYGEFSIFEIGKVYLPSTEQLPQEKSMLVGAMVFPKKVAKKEKQDLRLESNFFESKSFINNLLLQIGISDQYYDNFDIDNGENSKLLWHQGRSAEIKITGSGKSLGLVGEISPNVLRKYDISNRVVVFEFEMEKMLEISRSEREYAPIGKYPVVTRDISLLAQKNVRIDEILMIIQRAGGDLVLDVDLFDAIDFSDDSSSFAFHIILGASERTLNGKEVDELMNAIVEKLESELQVKLRR